MRICVSIIKNLISLLCLALMVTALSCGLLEKKTDEWHPVKPKKKSFVHTVKHRKENLKIIAAWYTGKDVNEKVLADANPNINPNLLLVGNRIYIPRNLLKTRKSMPDDYLKKWTVKNKKRKKKTNAVHSSKKKSSTGTSTTTSKKKLSSKKPPSSSENDDELDLFGPK